MKGMTADSFVSPLLWPLSLPYLAAVSARNLLYDRGVLAPHRSGVPVISIGNITAGGTGKTPFVIMLAGMLSRAGRRVAVVSRGYRRERPAKKPLLVSDGREIKCLVDEAGDEPFLIARRLLGSGGKPAMVIVCADRLAAAEMAASLGAEAVILDDGFQHRRLHRDLDIVLLDAEKPLDNGLLLPAGRLREGPGSLRRADAVVLTRSAGGAISERLMERLRPGSPIYHSKHAPLPPVRIEDWRSGKNAAGQAGVTGRVLLFSGIAKPDSFEASARQAGLAVGGHLRFPDHHFYGKADLERIAAAGGSFDAVVTTEKDAVRLPKDWNPRTRLLVLVVEMELMPREAERQLEEMITKGSLHHDFG
jgi:tetraacyldisaccharide 4'-kinase